MWHAFLTYSQSHKSGRQFPAHYDHRILSHDDVVDEERVGDIKADTFSAIADVFV